MAEVIAQALDVPEGSAKKFKIQNGQETLEGFLVHSNGKFTGFVNRCPHVSLPLDWGSGDFLTMDGKFVICRNHGALFKPETGECVDGPCLGDSLEAIPLKVEKGKIYR